MTEQEKQPRYFYVGQTVYHPVFGIGKVVSIVFNADYPIRVDFSDIEGGRNRGFTNDGRYMPSQPITLSQNPIPEIQNEPLPEIPDLKPGDVVVCWDNNKESAIIALFRSFSPSDKHPYAVCFTPTDTGDRCQFYKNCEKYDPEKHYRK